MTAPKAPVHLLWGEDPFLLREAALEIVGPDIQARELDAATWHGGELADLATPSLFGEPRALIVSDCRSLPDEGMRELTLYLAVPDPDAPLVLCATVGERARAPAALVKLVQPVGAVREVKLARKDLTGWLVQRSKGRRLDLASDAAGALVDTLGEDPAALDQGLVQLGSAFPGERLTRELVAEQFRGLGDQHIWDLCDRGFGRDLDGAMRSLRTLLESGDDGLMILGGVASRLRDLLRVRSLPDRMPAAELARAAGLRFDWQARRYREQARRFSLEELVRIHGQVVEADRALKSGASDEVVLPVLIGRIAGEPARV
ncbi:MAG TPA: DNA polymerase III subunit delta [Actinomycetota bacterium]|nr:DNA polymerase III subunit delta [Actinomycetota bacterium]